VSQLPVRSTTIPNITAQRDRGSPMADAEFYAVIAVHGFVPETRRCSAGCDYWPCDTLQRAAQSGTTAPPSTRPNSPYREK